MRISLILCTKNGGARLGRCLDHIDAQQGVDEMELLLVDNGSTDGESFDRLHAFAARTRFRCEVMQTFIPGNSAGRNVAIEKASGDLLIFLDDDCYAAPDLVTQWRRIFSELDVGYATGRVERYNPADSHLGCRTLPYEILLEPGRHVPRGFIQGSNMAFRRAFLDAAGPFDPCFGAGTPWAGEEWDVALRGVQAGWGGGYFPEPVVWHDHGRRDAETRIRTLYYDYGGGAVYAKHSLRRGGVETLARFGRELLRARDAHRIGVMLKGYLAWFISRNPKNMHSRRGPER